MFLAFISSIGAVIWNGEAVPFSLSPHFLHLAESLHRYPLEETEPLVSRYINRCVLYW